MVAIRHIALLLTLSMIALSPSSGLSGPPGPERPSDGSLFSQSTAEALNRDFSGHDISFLLLDARTGGLLASRWDNPEYPIPIGSLGKPFAALAYGEQHNFQFPRHTCRGTPSGCWLPHGHGDVDLSAALAYSCNSYFRMLTSGLTAADVSRTATRFGLEPPDQGTVGFGLAGFGAQWRISPLRLARAYLEMVRLNRQPGMDQILDGMVQSARRGTGAEVHRAVPYPDTLAKTGTAVCTHPRHSTGDGFAVVITPAGGPRILLMVRVHGFPAHKRQRPRDRCCTGLRTETDAR